MTSYSWPGAAQAVVFVSVNFDAESFDLHETAPHRLYGRFSYGRYGVRAGYPRLLDLLAKHAIPATFFVPASDARRHPALVRALADNGHEVGARGLDLEDFSKLGEREAQVLRESRDILADIAGKAPQGFRAPGGMMSPHTLELLVEQGFIYDSTFQDADHPYAFGLSQDRTLIEVPSAFALEDAPVYSARHTHARLMAIWRDEIAAMREEGVLIPLTLHLRGDFGSTRGARIEALDALLTEVTATPGLRFMSGGQIAEHALSLQMVREADPYAAHAATLANTVYRGDLAVKPI